MTAPTKATAPVNEIGYQQAVGQYMWWLYENETTPELIWPQSVYVYDQMRRTDAQVGSVLRAVTLPVLRTPWRVDPAGARDEVVKFVADDLGLPIVGQDPTPPPRKRDRFSWQDHLSEALLMLPIGYSYFEQVYRIDPDGGRAHLRKLALRPARTIEYVNVASDGGLVSIKQYWIRSGERPQPIPVDRLVAYIHAKEGGNWLGTSILRNCYKNWLLKDRLLRVQAQTIERNGMGIPLYKGQDGAPDLASGLAMAKAWRAGDAAGTAIPFGADLVLRGVEGTLPDAEPAIRYHDEQIARAVLAHFLNLGTQTGSWALGTTFADFFTLSLQTLAQQIADVATSHVVEDLVDINFGEDEPSPRIVFDEIGSRQAATAQALKLLIDTGVIHPDDILEQSTRQQYGLPPRDPNAPPPGPLPGMTRETLTGPAPTGAGTPAPAVDTKTGAASVAASATTEAGLRLDDLMARVAALESDLDDEDDDDLDEDTEALLVAMSEFAGEVTAKFNPALHPHVPKGSSKGGQFRSTVDKLIDALKVHNAAGGKGDPFAGYSREQLRRAAKTRGITLKRGASRDDISAALIADLTPGGTKAPTPTPKVAAPKAPTPTPSAPKVTTQKLSSPMAGKTSSERVLVNGHTAGAIHEDPAGTWTAIEPFGTMRNGGLTQHATRQQALDALTAAHLGTPTVAPAASPSVPPKVTTRSLSAGTHAVAVNGSDIGVVTQSSTGSWHANPGSASGLPLGPLSGGPWSRRKDAIDALVAATSSSGVTTQPFASGPRPNQKTSLAVDLGGTHIGAVHEDLNGNWTAVAIASNRSRFIALPPNATKVDAIKALVDAHNAQNAHVAPPAPTAAPAPPKVTTRKLPSGSYAVGANGVDLGTVGQDFGGKWIAEPSQAIPGARVSGGHRTRKDAIDALVTAHAAVPPSAPAPAAAPSSAHAPEVQSARDVLYGVDPKGKTAARQMAVYGAMRRSHFDSLDSAEQSTLLGDLSYIATTAKGPNGPKAQKILDRFTPAGTPAGTIPKQAVIPPASASSGQMRIADPAGTPGLLKMLPAGQRGSSGDGWTRTASGGTGPWGQYGAAGLMLRHVDAQGTERFLMVERGPGISDPGKWQFPGGAKEQSESFHQGAAREVVEELGFKASDLDAARVHGTHTNEVAAVQVPGMHGGQVPWAYVSIAATVPDQLMPDLSTHHARAETSDAKWMTAAEIRGLDTSGKLLRPLAGGQLEQNVMSLFPSTSPPKPGARTTRPPRLTGPPPAPKSPHKPSKGRDLISDTAAQDHLRAEVAKVRKNYRGKTADERLSAIGAMQGYDDTPTVATKAEIDRLLATGDYIEAWRGIEGTQYSWRASRNGPHKTAAQIHEEMRSGPAYYGTGVYGNGYYLSTKKSVAQQYSDKTKNSVVRVLIPKAAKTDDIDSIESRARRASSSGPAGIHTGRSGDKGGGTLRNPGRYAAAAGLDGIEILHTSRPAGGNPGHIAGPGQPAYTWLNRSVLIVQEAEA